MHNFTVHQHGKVQSPIYGTNHQTIVPKTLEEAARLRKYSIVHSVAFSPDGKFVISGNGDATIKLWDVKTGKKLRTFIGHSDPVISTVLSSDGNFILSANNSIKLWEVATGRELRTFAANGYDTSSSLALSQDGKIALLSNNNSFIKLREMTTGRELRIFGSSADFTNVVALSSDGRLALSGSWHNTMNLWEVATGRKLRTFNGHSGYINSVTLSPDN
ncbi:hypothetical protein TI05_19345, partial [Achromatium sp. WMS3]